LNSVALGPEVIISLSTLSFDDAVLLELFVRIKISKRNWIKTNPSETINIQSGTTYGLAIGNAGSGICFDGYENSFVFESRCFQM